MATTTTQRQSWQAGFLGTPHFGHLDDLMQQCVQECLSCFTVCEQTLQHCLRKGGKYVAPEHVKLLIDCAESCRMSAAMMSRESRYHAAHCALCADICKACQQSCEAFGGDAQMKACADACRACHDACRKMGAPATAQV